MVSHVRGYRLPLFAYVFLEDSEETLEQEIVVDGLCRRVLPDLQFVSLSTSFALCWWAHSSSSLEIAFLVLAFTLFCSGLIFATLRHTGFCQLGLKVIRDIRLLRLLLLLDGGRVEFGVCSSGFILGLLLLFLGQALEQVCNLVYLFVLRG
jgi:hypothetical protein